MKPLANESPEFFHRYIELIVADDALSALTEDLQESLAFFRSIPEDKAEYAYETGKWTVKEVLGHVMDAEIHFARKAQRLAGMDTDEALDFRPAEFEPGKALKDSIDDFEKIRDYTISLYNRFDEDMLAKSEPSNKHPITVLALGYLIAGHCVHHSQVIKERYL